MDASTAMTGVDKRRRPAVAATDATVSSPAVIEVAGLVKEYPGVVALGGVQTLWFQLGLRNDEAAAIATSAGITVVQNRCLKIEHARFHGGLHLAGFDTGVVSSRRSDP